MRNKQTILSSLKLAGLIFAVVLMFAIVASYTVQRPQNKALTMEERVSAAKADIKIQEKRRVDLVHNLADAVKSYNKHESETLIAIAEGRKANGDIDNVSTLISGVVEAYPELKSNENYKRYMTELAVTENLIAEYRSNYTSQVKHYNSYVRSWPARTFLNFTGYEKQVYEELDFNAPVDAPQNLLGD